MPDGFIPSGKNIFSGIQHVKRGCVPAEFGKQQITQEELACLTYVAIVCTVQLFYFLT